MNHRFTFHLQKPNWFEGCWNKATVFYLWVLYFCLNQFQVADLPSWIFHMKKDWFFESDKHLSMWPLLFRKRTTFRKSIKHLFLLNSPLSTALRLLLQMENLLEGWIKEHGLKWRVFFSLRKRTRLRTMSFPRKILVDTQDHDRFLRSLV